MIKSFINRIKRSINPVKYWRAQGVKIGKDCEIYSDASFGSEPYLITIGDHVRVNSGVVFVTHDGGVWVLRELYAELSDIDRFGKITVGNNVHIGTNVVIMPGVTIGNNCIIGVGAIVTKSVPDNSVAVGIPARVIETTDEYKNKNYERFVHTKKMTRQEKKGYLLKKYTADQE